MLFEYLIENYALGEQIFIEDIRIEGINRHNLIQQLETLTDNGKIVRYEKGIYYISKEIRFGHDIGPSQENHHVLH